MSKREAFTGSTSNIEYVMIYDSSSSIGAGLTGLVYNSGSLTAYYVRPGGSATAITLVTQTVTGAYSSGGFVEVSSTNTPGLYRLDLPNACYSSGANKVLVMLKGATNMAPCVFEIQLVGFNPDAASAVRKNTAYTFPFKMLDSADLKTGKIGVSVTSQRSLDGGAFSSASGSVSEISNGWYKFTGAAADFNGDNVLFRFTGTDCQPTEMMFVTQP